jgi:hypothetical protein
MIYIAKSCCLILKVLGTVQHHIFCYNYIHTTLLGDLYAIYESQEIRAKLLVLNGWRSKTYCHKNFQSPLHKRTKCVLFQCSKASCCLGLSSLIIIHSIYLGFSMFLPIRLHISPLPPFNILGDSLSIVMMGADLPTPRAQLIEPSTIHHENQ